MINENFFKRCGNCFNFKCEPRNFRIGFCVHNLSHVHIDTVCPIPDYFIEKPIKSEEKEMLKFGELLPLIKCEFVIEYKGEIYYSFGNTLQSVLKAHFAGLTVKELATFDDECLKVVLI